MRQIALSPTAPASCKVSCGIVALTQKKKVVRLSGPLLLTCIALRSSANSPSWPGPLLGDFLKSQFQVLAAFSSAGEPDQLSDYQHFGSLHLLRFRARIRSAPLICVSSADAVLQHM